MRYGTGSKDLSRTLQCMSDNDAHSSTDCRSNGAHSSTDCRSNSITHGYAHCPIRSPNGYWRWATY